jgi:hypothetical protein
MVLIVVVASSVSACQGSVSWDQHSTATSSCRAGIYHDVFQVKDQRFRRSGGRRQQVTRFSMYRNIIRNPAFGGTGCTDYSPALTVYVNCCGRTGTAESARKQCTSAGSCYVPWESDWFDAADAADVGCTRNGSAYAYEIWHTPSVAGQRYHVCGRVRWHGPP